MFELPGRGTLILGGAMLLLLIVVSGIGVWYYRDTQARFAAQDQLIGELQTAKAIQDQTIADIKRQADDNRKFVENMQTNFATIQGKTSVMENLLTGQRLQRAASQRPTQVQERANLATKSLFNAIQSATDPAKIMEEISK